MGRAAGRLPGGAWTPRAAPGEPFGVWVSRGGLNISSVKLSLGCQRCIYPHLLHPGGFFALGAGVASPQTPSFLPEVTPRPADFYSPLHSVVFAAPSCGHS